MYHRLAFTTYTETLMHGIIIVDDLTLVGYTLGYLSMKKIVLSLLCGFLFPIYCTAQNSVSDMLPAHASALQEFLTSRPEPSGLMQLARFRRM